MKLALNSRSLLSLALIMPVIFALTANPLLAMDNQQNAQTAQVGDGGDGAGLAGVIIAAGGHGDRDRDRPNSTVPGAKERWFIPVSVWAGTATLLCLLISAGWIIEHFVGGDCPDQPTRMNGTNASSVCPSITSIFNASNDCSFAAQQCDFRCK